MNYRLVSRLLGGVVLMLAPLLGICLALAAWEGRQLSAEDGLATFQTSFALTALCGLVLFLIGRKAKGDELLRRDAVAVAALGWILAAFIGSLPYFLNGDISFAHAFFESTSGFTTTGSTIYGDLESLPNAILLWRSVSQWIGGLGILVLFAAILPTLGISGKSLMGSETSMDLTLSPTSRIGDLALRCWLVYIALTLLCWLAVWGVGRASVNGFEALLYALTTVSTGGFAPHTASVGHFDSLPVELTMCCFMILSSVSMILLINITRGRWLTRAGRQEAVFFLLLLLSAWLLIVLSLFRENMSGGTELFREAFFPVVSFSTSAGFGTVDYDEWPLMARVVLAFLMIFGGCSGSTAGGLKVIRLLLLLKILRLELKKTFRPNLVTPIGIDGRAVHSKAQFHALAFLAFAALIVVASTGIVAQLEPQINDLNTALGAVFGTFFNMGPGFGLVGPTDHFGTLQPVTLLFLSLLMLFGRLEIFVLAALFSRSFWRAY